LAAECWGGKASGVRAVLGVEQVWPEEDRCGLTSWRLSAAAARLRWHLFGVSTLTTRGSAWGWKIEEVLVAQLLRVAQRYGLVDGS
jgi:hypothetical protein